MKHQLSGELLKFRTTRSPFVAAAAAGAFAALIPTLASADPQRFGVAPLTAASLTDLLRAPGHVVAAAALLVGILAAAGEHTHRTILTSRLAEPDPTRILAAKVLAAAIVGAVIAAVAELIALAVSVVGLRLNDIAVTPFEPANVGAALTVVLAAAVACVVGTGLGSPGPKHGGRSRHRDGLGLRHREHDPRSSRTGRLGHLAARAGLGRRPRTPVRHTLDRRWLDPHARLRRCPAGNHRDS